MANKTLYVIRHGNTFDSGQSLLRVGCQTDLDLSRSGRKQIENLSTYISSQNITIDHLYAGKLLRAQQSAEIILQQCNFNPQKYTINTMLNEVNYGIDDGQPEELVVHRIGQQALDAWENDNIVPAGWDIQPAKLVASWQKFIRKFIDNPQQNIIMLVTSNGLARFLAPALNLQEKTTKIATGSISKLVYQNKRWHIEYWNFKVNV